MSTYLYQGIKNDGTNVYGSKNVYSKNELEDFLKGKDIQPTNIFESKTPYKENHYKNVNPYELSIFCKEVSVIFFSYITIIEGIHMLYEQSSNKVLRTALWEIFEFMDRGFTFTQSISMYPHVFGNYLIKMVAMGENSGNLDTIFTSLSDYYNKEHKIRKKVKSAVIYPIILAMIMAGIIVFLIKEILPIFDQMLSQIGGNPSSITGLIISTGNFFNANALVFLVAIICLVIILILYFRSEKGEYTLDKMKAKTPLVKYVVFRIVTARFARSISIQLDSGVNLVNALEETIPLTENKYLEEKLYIALKKIENGENLPDTLNSVNIFPPLFIKMVIIGDKTGNIVDMLTKSADLFEDQVDDAIEKTTRILEPALITILSIVVGIILLSIMIPMINIMQSI